MIFYILNAEDKIIETIQSPDEEGTGGITALNGIVEEKLSTYELLELIVPADSEGLEDIKEEMTLIFEDVSGWREYTIYEIEDEDGDNFNTSIKAELASTELIDEVIEENYSGVSINPQIILDSLLMGTRYSVGHVDSSVYNQAFNVNTEYMNVLEAINEFADNYSAEIRFSYQVDGNRVVNRFVDVYKNFGEYRGKIFEIDRDMESVKRTVNTELIKTTIIPYSTEQQVDSEDSENNETYRLDIKNIDWSKVNGDPIDKPLGQNYLVDPVALENWGKLNSDGTRRHKKISMEFDTDNPETMISMAWVQLGRYTQPKTTYEVKAVDLYAMTENEDLKHEQILLGDTGGVKDHYFSRPIEIQTRLVEGKRDLFDSRNNEYVFGSSKAIFSANIGVEQTEEIAKEVNNLLGQLGNIQVTVDGKNKVFRGSDNPVSPVTGDIWFRPHPSKQGHSQMLVFNGASWVIEADTSDLEDASRLKFGVIDGTEVNVINLIADNITSGSLDLQNLTMKNGDKVILDVDNNGNVRLNISKMTIGVLDLEEELNDKATKAELEAIELTEGPSGKNAYEIAVENGFTGTETQWINSLIGEKGEGGKTAYEIAVEEGFSGTQNEWLNSLQGLDGYTPIKGVDYFDGENGQDGKSSYLWVRYSQNSNGNPMTTTPTDAKYIGVATTTTATAPTGYASYTWTLIKGQDGVKGEDGVNGETSYLHIKYSNDGGTTFTANNGETVGEWIGTYVNFVEVDSTSVSAYTWNKVTGPQGPTGPQGATGSQGPKGDMGTSVDSITEYYLATSSSSGVTTATSGWTTTLQPITSVNKYLWNYEKINFSDNTSQNTIPVIMGVYGDQGPQGATGSTGSTGATGRSITGVTEYYLATSLASGVTRTSPSTWSTTMQQTTPTNKYLWNYEKITWSSGVTTTYVEPIIIGIHGDKGDTGSTGPQGPQGVQGVQGPTGANGISQYVHIRYSANSNGNPMTTTPQSTTAYIGLANITSATAPTGYASYTWTLFKGPQGATGGQGIQGPQGTDGTTTYTWVKYADDKNGAGISDTPDGKIYIGLAFNKTTQSESGSAGDYSWSELPQNIEIGGRNLIVEYQRILDRYISSSTDYNGLPSGAGFFITPPIPIGTANYLTASITVGTTYEDLRIIFLDDAFATLAFYSKETGLTATWEVPTGATHAVFCTSYSDGNVYKLEKGNKVTDWSPSPEDIEAQIGNKADQENVSTLGLELSGVSAELEEEKKKIISLSTLNTDYKEIIDANTAQGEEAIGNVRSLIGYEDPEDPTKNVEGRIPLIENGMGTFTEKWTFLETNITMGNEGIFIGQDKTGIMISPRLGENPARIDFVDGGESPVAEITEQHMKINRGIFVESAQIGEHKIETLGDGHTVFTWV